MIYYGAVVAVLAVFLIVVLRHGFTSKWEIDYYERNDEPSPVSASAPRNGDWQPTERLPPPPTGEVPVRPSPPRTRSARTNL